MRIKKLLLIAGVFLLSNICFAGPRDMNSSPINIPQSKPYSPDYNSNDQEDMLPVGISWYMIGIDEAGRVVEGYMTRVNEDGSVEYEILGENSLEEIKTGGNK